MGEGTGDIWGQWGGGMGTFRGAWSCVGMVHFGALCCDVVGFGVGMERFGVTWGYFGVMGGIWGSAW